MHLVFDASASVTHRRIDENGFLRVKDCPISTHGVFDFARCEVGLEGDPNELVKVLRSLETISNPEFLASCQNLPLIDDHTHVEGIIQDSGDLEPGEDPAKKGVCGVMTNVRFDEKSGWVVADLIIYARAMIRQIMANEKTELSLGYGCDFVIPGVEHAAEQIGIVGNHLALVARARVPGARVLDSAFNNPSNEDVLMNKKPKARALDSASVEKLREVLLPALQAILADEPEEKLKEEEQKEVTVATDDVTSEELQETREEVVEPESDPATEEGSEDIKLLLKQLLDALKGGSESSDVEAVVGDKEVDEETEEEKEKAKTVTMDSMFQAVATRDALYQRVSKVVGVFDHSAMSAEKVAQYGVKKLGIKCADGHEATALDAYLQGAEAQAAKAATTTTKKAGDSSAAQSPELDAYLNGK